jgi:S1-C subfamily serine protease
MLHFKTRLSFLGKAYFAVIFVLCLSASQVLALTDDEKNTIGLYEKASKSVVNITTIVIQQDFFYGPTPREGAGSGVIIDERGYILTNNHVIKDARRIEVTLSNGKKYPGKLIGAAPSHDLAIVRINAPEEKLIALSFGSSDNLKIGQKVLAIGNPFGLDETLTTGVISSLGRSIRGEDGVLIEGLIQTDAAINPGNSGGPLLDSSGAIIGINTAIFSPSGGSVGIGFAIPGDTAKQIVADIIEKGYSSYPWLGVSYFPLFPGLARELRLKTDWGLMVQDVFPNGPADKAGIRGGRQLVQAGNMLLAIDGDVIVEMNGSPINNADDFLRLLNRFRPGATVKLKILRNNQFQEVPMKLGEKPNQ